jgi:sulfur carrier protein ThiS
MRHADDGTDNLIEVQIGRFGHDLQTVRIPENSTVADALTKAGIRTSSTENIWVDSERANLNDILEDGDTLQIVSPKQAGGISTIN